MPASAASIVPERVARRGIGFQLNAWLPVAFAIGCIAVESQPFLGADHTTGPLQHFVEWFTGPLTRNQWWHWHHAIRKCGHFAGYGLVSLAWFRAFWKTLPADWDRGFRQAAAHVLAMVGTLLVAGGDEFHQTFLPNRTGTPWDVLLDCCGALLAQGIVFLVLLRRVKNRRSLHSRFDPDADEPAQAGS